MKVIVRQGDVLDEIVDVVICTANPMLRMSGGVNGALLLRGGKAIQSELDAHLASLRITHVAPGTVVRTGPGPLAVKHILHAVGVNVFYESSVDLIQRLLEAALKEASNLGVRSVATPALATGYGPLSIAEFGAALKGAILGEFPGIEELRVVLRRSDAVDEVSRIVHESGAPDRNS